MLSLGVKRGVRGYCRIWREDVGVYFGCCLGGLGWFGSLGWIRYLWCMVKFLLFINIYWMF